MKQKTINFINNPLIKKSFKVLTLRVLGVAFLFTVTLSITNNFNNELVGKYDISRSILFIFGSICLLGLNQSIIYYSGYFIANNQLSSIKSLYLKMIIIIIITSTLLLLLFLTIPKHIINEFYKKEVYGIVLKTLGILFFYALTMLNIELYRAINKIETSEIFRNVFRYGFFFIALIIIDSFGIHNKLVELFLFNFIFLGTISTFFVFFSLKKLQEDSIKVIISFKEIIIRSYPMSISIVCFLAMQSTDIILLGKFMDFSKVAYYAVAVKLTMIISIVLSSVNTVYATKISELFALSNFKDLKENIKKATRLIFILTMPIILFMFFSSNYILSLFGEDYIYAEIALKILLIGQVVNTLSGSVGMYMDMTGNQKIFQRIIVTALALNILLNWILIPKYGLIGAAVATTISTVAWNIFSVWFLYNKRQIKTFIH
ncbi:MAG: oligosaccharide flippase family protein [Arcobacter sp.]|nr:oligosaccharide flippase family protein [Arcobacter sp.]